VLNGPAAAANKRGFGKAAIGDTVLGERYSGDDGTVFVVRASPFVFMTVLLRWFHTTSSPLFDIPAATIKPVQTASCRL
jgi:hypothetical protein